eukprot:467467-Alexandrium_andersonii.AAC.1
MCIRDRPCNARRKGARPIGARAQHHTWVGTTARTPDHLAKVSSSLAQEQQPPKSPPEMTQEPEPRGLSLPDMESSHQIPQNWQGKGATERVS